MATLKSKILGVIVKCTSIPSILGSCYIAQEVLRDRKKRKMTYHRLLLAMSISDILSSTTIFIGSWAIPRGTPDIFMAFGTKTTCNIQGFFIQLGIATPLYNGVLSLYYLLQINFGWKETRIHKIEPYMHAIPILWSFGTALACLLWDQYSFASLWCWLGAEAPANYLRYFFYYGWVIIMLVFVTVTMIMIYRHVLQQENLIKKYDFERNMIINKNNKGKKNKMHTYRSNQNDTNTTAVSNMNNNEENDKKKCEAAATAAAVIAARIEKRKKRDNRHSKKVFNQALYYVGAFYLSFIFALYARLSQSFKFPLPYPMLLAFAFFFPLQGFFNFIVYMRPRYINHVQKHGSLTSYFNASTASNYKRFSRHVVSTGSKFKFSSRGSYMSSDSAGSSVNTGDRENKTSMEKKRSGRKKKKTPLILRIVSKASKSNTSDSDVHNRIESIYDNDSSFMSDAYASKQLRTIQDLEVSTNAPLSSQIDKVTPLRMPLPDTDTTEEEEQGEKDDNELFSKTSLAAEVEVFEEENKPQQEQNKKFDVEKKIFMKISANDNRVMQDALIATATDPRDNFRKNRSFSSSSLVLLLEKYQPISFDTPRCDDKIDMYFM